MIIKITTNSEDFMNFDKMPKKSQQQYFDELT